MVMACSLMVDFFVLSPKVIDLIVEDSSIWERKPLEKLATSNQLEAFIHKGFWQLTLPSLNVLLNSFNYATFF